MCKIQRLLFTIICLITVTSSWADATYNITIQDGIANGTVTSSAASSLPGATITLTVTPSEGYYLSKLTAEPYTDGGNASARKKSPTMLSAIAITDNHNGTYSFIMPNKNVLVSAEFSQTSSISGAIITLSPASHTFDWQEYKPIVSSVTVNNNQLVEGTDYTVGNYNGITSYSASTDDRTITITGIGNYSGTATKTFNITQVPISSASVTLGYTSTTFNDSDQKPSVELNYLGHTMTEGVDYTLSFPSDVKNQGSKTITITGTGNFTESITKQYSINRKPLTEDMVSLSGFDNTTTNSYTYDGNAKTPTVAVKWTKEDNSTEVTLTQSTNTDKDYTVTYSNNINVGTATVKVTGNGNYTGDIYKTFSILANESSTAFYARFDSDPDLTYDGTPKTATVNVSKTENGTDYLTENTDYSIAWHNNTNAGTNTAYVVITGKNNYTGTRTLYFSIKQRAINSSGITITPSPTSFNYNGNEQKPAISIKDGSTQLYAGVDYTVEYPSDVTSAGTSKTITIRGTGNYQGQATTAYAINQLDLSGASIELPSQSYVYNRAEQKPLPVVRVGTLVISSNDYTTTHTKNDPTSDTDVTSVGTKRVTISGQNNCTGSAYTTYEITAKPLTIAMVTLSGFPAGLDHFVYDGNAKEPTVTVMDGEATLTKDTDYSVTLTNNTNVGTATVTVQGLGNYGGVVEKTFSIQATAASDFTIADITAVVFDGNEHKPTPAVSYGTTPLTLNTDYTLSWSNNINAGTATVTVTGKGGYAGSTGSKTFTINPKTLTEEMVVLSNFTVTTTDTEHPNKGFTYNGNTQKPNVTITDSSAPITADDYDITNAGGTDVGNYIVTVTGKRNYVTTGHITLNYSIYQRDISSATVTLNQLASYIYDGSNKEPGVSQVAFSSEVVSATQYDVAYSNNKNAGTATVTVTGKNNYTGTTSTTFTIQKKVLADNMIVFDHESFEYDGNNKAPNVSMQDMSGESNIINKESDCDISIPTSSAVGTYTVNVSAKSTGNYTGSASRQYSIVPQGSVSFDVSWKTAPNFTYDGTEHKPEVKVTKHGSTTDELQTSDYDVEYSNNINAGTNTASVTVTGKGNYSGTQTLHFTIAKKEMTNDMLTLTGGPFTYDGTIKKPTVAVSDPAGANLIKADDYVISNEGNINAGEYTVTATATSGGNYSGSSSQTYTISPYALTTDNTTITLSQTSLVYDGTAKTPEVQLVKVGSSMVVSTYNIAYDNNINAAAATAETAPQVTITGTGNFTGSAVKKFTITPKTVTTDMILFNQENFTYNAAVQKPVVTVKDGDKPLTVNTDYTLTNEGGTNIGTYYAQIEGKGNYQGTAKRGYSIVTDGASMFTVNDIESVTYDGTEKTPEVVVLDNVKTAGTTLTENVHYTKNYINNKNAGIASVIITGIGSYAGTITKNFTINPKALTEEMVVLAENSFAFNSLQQKPTVTVSDGTIMTENDYTITNNGGVNCGTYHVVVTGKGNYTGEIDKTFTITQLDISTGTVTLYELQSYAYDGKPKKPGVREIIVGKVTVPTTGYTTSYGDNINVGKGTVTVTGQGDFRGTKTVEFEIIKKTITADMITLSNQEYTYNGSTHKPEVTVKDGETTLKLGTDYTLTNNGGVNAGTYDVTITGIGNYTGSVTKNFTIRVQEAGVFVMSLSQESMVFTGSELKPVVTVKDSEKTLTEGTHYTVTYNNNINVGVATVMVEGIGQYKGSKMKTFIITPKTLTDAMVTLSSSEFTYNVMQQRPVVTVQDGSSLTLNDYVVTNDGGVNVGTYKVTVIGKNNYMGSVEKSFSISSLDISEAKVILYELANYVYDGTAKNPGVREVGIGTIVVPTSSYTSEISDNVNAGKVTVTVTGSGNFSGSASTSFNILQKPLSEEMVSLDKTSFPYNEKKQKPVVTVSDGNIMTEADYTITNEGGTEEGTYDVIVTGKNNYTGTITKKYDIIRSDMPVDVKPGDENPGADDATISVTPVSKGSNEVKVSDIKTTESESVTIPETCTINGQTYTITGIADGAFANASNLKDLYLPETEEPLTIGKDAIPAAANVHVPLSLLAQYALMPAMAENFRNGKVMTTVKAKNRYWTFSSGVDVYVPEGLDVYIAREHNDYSVSIIQLTDNELAVGGQRVIKANNGVLINSSGNDTPYTFVACPKRMTSGTAITTDDNKDYGLRNCLIPVIVATHFESGNYYFMKNNEFYRITDESEDIKVPAGKAVLYLKSAKASARVRLVNGTTDISSETIDDQQDEWYTIEGLKLDGRPTKEGIYIHNKKKVYIRK